MPSITALHPTGFAVCLEVTSLDHVESVIHDLLRRGYRPAIGGDGWARTPEGLPLCPRHQVAMRPREKQGDTWHSHQVPDPRTGASLYCRGYASPSSPGWEILETVESTPPRTAALGGNSRPVSR